MTPETKQCSPRRAIDRSHGFLAVRYYNDVWVFHLDELYWEPVADDSSQKPAKRGGCRAVVHDHYVYIYGGYSKFRDEEDKDIEHGKTVDDMWRLNLHDYKVPF